MNPAPFMRAGEDCPSLEELIDGLQAPPNEPERQSAEAHLAKCAHCQAEAALFRDFESPAARAGEKAAVGAIVRKLRDNPPYERARWWSKILERRVWMPAAAALAAALIVVTVNVQRNDSGQRQAEDLGSFRAAAIEGTAPSGDVETAPRQLVWTPVAGAARYRITVSEVDQTELWSSLSEAPPAALPEPLVSRFVPLKTVNWTVVALDGAGAAMAKSPVQSFRVVPKN